MIRTSARAILIQDNRIILIKRVRPGREPYWVAPGGGLEKQDGSLEAALHREAFEELGAKIEILRPILTVEGELHTSGVRRDHFFLCKLLEYDLSRRTGEEFKAPVRGQYIVQEVQLDARIGRLNILPYRLKGFLTRNHGMLFDALRKAEQSRMGR